MTNIQYKDCMIEKFSVYFGQFLVVKTEEFTVHNKSGCFCETNKKKYVKLQLVVVKTMTISTGEINLTFYLRCVHRMMTFLVWKVCLEILDSGVILQQFEDFFWNLLIRRQSFC